LAEFLRGNTGVTDDQANFGPVSGFRRRPLSRPVHSYQQLEGLALSPAPVCPAI
jgi:hypothetical protein